MDKSKVARFLLAHPVRIVL